MGQERYAVPAVGGEVNRGIPVPVRRTDLRIGDHLPIGRDCLVVRDHQPGRVEILRVALHDYWSAERRPALRSNRKSCGGVIGS